jgi:hypothetical protein
MTTLHHDDLGISVEEEEDGQALLQLTATVNLAGHVCHKLGIGQRQPDDELDLLKCPGAKALNLDEDEIQRALVEVDEIFTENRDFFIG